MIARASQGTLQSPTNLLRSCDKILRKYSELKMVKDAWKAFFNISLFPHMLVLEHDCSSDPEYKIYVKKNPITVYNR